MATESAVAAAAPAERLPLRSRISYGLFDTAGQLTCFVSSYLMYYLTDVVGIAVFSVATLMLLTRFVDFVDAPVWGMIIDHTHSRYGKCRPWFLWLAIPFAVVCSLIFYDPGFSMENMIIYISVLYVLYNVIFTGLNTPITAILPLLSKLPDERVVLNSFRMVGGQIGVLLMNATALPLVGLLGGDDAHKGFFLTALIFSTAFVLLTFFAFANVREVDSGEGGKEQSVPLKDSFKAMKGNWPWVIIVVANLGFWIAMISRNVSLIYYLTYNMGHKELIPVMNSLGTIGMVMMVLLPIFCRHMMKSNVWICGLIASVIGEIGMWVVGDNIPLFIAMFIVVCLGNSVACSLPFAMLGAAVDYGEWHNGIRSAGFLTAVGSSFCIKVGCGVGAAIPGYIMAYAGYVANQEQTAEALFAIDFSFIWLPALIFALSIVPLLFYRRYERMEERIRHDLEQKHIAAMAAES